jgi:hypothetical protein
MSLAPAERETVITLNDEDEFAHVYTSQRPWITKLRKHPSARLIEEGKFEGSAWARFEVEKELVRVAPRRRKARSGAAEHLRAARLETASTEGVSDQDEADAA